MRTLIFFILIIYTSFYTNGVKAQEVSAQIPLQSFTVETKNLLSNQSYYTLQDKKGFIWFCSQRGVSRFDGRNIRHFSIKDNLPNADVWRLFEDTQGRIWLNYFGNELAYILNDTIHKVYADRTKINASFFSEKNGTVWVGDFYLENDSFKMADYTYKMDKDEFVRFAVDKETYISIDIKNNLSYVKNNQIIQTCPILPDDKDISQNKFLNRSYYVSDSLLIFLKGMEIVLVNFKTKKQKSIFTNNTISNANLHFVARDKWVLSTNKEIIEFDINGNIHEHIKIKDFNFSDDIRINNLFKDREGGVWINTKNEGIFYASATARKNKYWLLKATINTKILKYDKEQNLCIFISDKGEVYCIKNDTISKKKVSLPSKNFVNRGFLPLTKNEYFVVGDGVNHILNTHSLEYIFEKIPSIPDSLSSRIKNLAYKKENGEEFLVLATMVGAFLVHKNQENIQVDKISPTGRSYGAAISKDNKIVFENKGKLYRYDYRQKESIPIDSNKTFSCFYACENKIFVGTQGQGLFCLNENNQYQLLSTLDDNICINDIVTKDGNTIYLATTDGIRIWNGKSVEKITQSDGLPSKDILSINIINDVFYLGTNQGVIAMKNTEGKKALTTVLTIYPRKIQIINKEQNIKNKTFINYYYENNIRIEWDCPYFSSPENLRFEYVLKTPEKTNKPISTDKNYCEYSELSPNEYVITITAYNDREGIKSEPLQFTFLIYPPWWKRKAFYIALINIFLIVIYGLFNWYKNYEKQKRHLAEKAFEALQTQINMHFSANVLTAIQKHILMENPIEASNYLADFAILMRLFLESSRKKNISIHEEIDLNKYYLTLQKLRYDNKFDYIIKHSNIDIYNTFIPSMLVQPFVENAIEHGFRGNKEKGLLQIQFYLNDSQIIIEIEDNGVGRKMAKIRNQQNFQGHISRAWENIQERIELLKKINNLHIYMEVIDKKNTAGEGIGTIVKIHIQNSKNV